MLTTSEADSHTCKLTVGEIFCIGMDDCVCVQFPVLYIYLGTGM